MSLEDLNVSCAADDDNLLTAMQVTRSNQTDGNSTGWARKVEKVDLLGVKRQPPHNFNKQEERSCGVRQGGGQNERFSLRCLKASQADFVRSAK
jgi:hypothetical protein